MTRGHAVPFANSTWAFTQEDDGEIVPAICGELVLWTPRMRPVIGVNNEGRVEIRSCTSVKLVGCREIVRDPSDPLSRSDYELTVLLFDGRTCRVPSTSLLAYRKGSE